MHARKMQTLLFAVAASLPLMSGCSVLKDPTFWADTLNSGLGHPPAPQYQPQPAVQSTYAAPRSVVQPASAVVETHIEGEFFGWDGDTVWKMSNGQIWQQAEYAYQYHYAYRPNVLIYGSRGTFSMKVDGVTERVTVERLSGSLSEAFIREVSSDGSIIKLDDGSVHEVNAAGQVKAMLWLPAQKVLKLPQRLFNLGKGQSVKSNCLK